MQQKSICAMPKRQNLQVTVMKLFSTSLGGTQSSHTDAISDNRPRCWMVADDQEQVCASVSKQSSWDPNLPSDLLLKSSFSPRTSSIFWGSTSVHYDLGPFSGGDIVYWKSLWHLILAWQQKIRSNVGDLNLDQQKVVTAFNRFPIKHSLSNN